MVTSHYDGDQCGQYRAPPQDQGTDEIFYDHGDAAVKDRDHPKPSNGILWRLRRRPSAWWWKRRRQIPFKGIDSAGGDRRGKHITTPVKGGGAPNPYCKTPSR